MLPTFTNILVPVDFSPVSKRVLANALSIAKRFEASVHVVHAFELPPPLRPDLTVWSGEFRASLEVQAHGEGVRAMRALLGEQEFSYGKVSTEVKEGHPYDVIIAAAEAMKSDLIVMGTHGRTGLSHLVMGSVAEKVMRHAACPVLTVRSLKTE